MIRNKVDYKYYLAEDLKRYHVRFIDRFIFSENYQTLKYLRVLRRLEYLTNKEKYFSEDRILLCLLEL